MNFTFFFAALLVLLEVVVLCPGAVGTEGAAAVPVVVVVDEPHGDAPAVIFAEGSEELAATSSSVTRVGSLTLPTTSMHSSGSAKLTLPSPLEKNLRPSNSSRS